jgi:hypothetical protein
MILDNPGTSPSVIAHAHGFSAVEVAELMPIFLDNLRADFSTADAPALTPPAPQPGETPEEHADRYLRELAQDGRLDVVRYDTLAAVDTGLGEDPGLDEVEPAAEPEDADLAGADLDDLDSDLGSDLDSDLDADLDSDAGHAPAAAEAPDDTAPGEPGPLLAECDEPDLDADDPFVAVDPPETPFDDAEGAGPGADPATDDPGDEFAVG